MKWRFWQIKHPKPHCSDAIVPLSASMGHLSRQRPSALAPLRAEHPLSHGGMVSSRSLAVRKHMLLLYLLVPLPSQQPFAHCSVHTHPLQQTEYFLFLEAFVWRGNLFLMPPPGYSRLWWLFALLSLLGRAAGRDEDKARTKENLLTLMDAIRELHLLQAGQASSSSCLLSAAACLPELLFLG